MWWTQPQTPLHGLALAAFQPSHCFQLNPLPCKHMGNPWVFLFSCRSRVLNNIQKDSATYHPVAAKVQSSPFPAPLPPHSIFPLRILGKLLDEKEQIYNGAIFFFSSSLTVINEREQPEKCTSTEEGGH